MTEQGTRKGGGGKLSRSETVTVRFDPKLRYLAELAARKQRRTLSSFVEWAVERSLGEVVLGTHFSGKNGKDARVVTADQAARNLWDVDPCERFARLALTYPELLLHDEQLLWKQVEDSRALARARIPASGGLFSLPEMINWLWLQETGFPRLRDHWDTFCAIAEGRLGRDKLPRFEE